MSERELKRLRKQIEEMDDVIGSLINDIRRERKSRETTSKIEDSSEDVLIKDLVSKMQKKKKRKVVDSSDRELDSLKNI
jgi:hypothetical protein